MEACDILIVGGGPAGSTCARALTRAGFDVAILDKASFPRDKVCAGWITPQVIEELELDLEDYRRSRVLQPITSFIAGLGTYPAQRVSYDREVSYGIRRCEFDDFLLRRAGVRVLDGTPVSSFRRAGSRWIVNEAIDTRVVIGAGGHFCPVARHLRGRADASQPVVAKEAEFRVARDGSRVAGQMPMPKMGLRCAVMVRSGESVREVISAPETGYLLIDAVA